MADRIEGIKRLLEVAVSAVTPQSPTGRGRRGGKDFMRDDLTYGAGNNRY